ncbi:hypothetical protein MXB_4779 [Myxobolus squamalis]|nr:hypothetical protein MXB_4779 [Myxobolus squamalis]
MICKTLYLTFSLFILINKVTSPSIYSIFKLNYLKNRHRQRSKSDPSFSKITTLQEFKLEDYVPVYHVPKVPTFIVLNLYLIG